MRRPTTQQARVLAMVYIPCAVVLAMFIAIHLSGRRPFEYWPQLAVIFVALFVSTGLIWTLLRRKR